MEGLHAGDVDKFQIIPNFDADSVAHLGDDFVWALVLRVERRLHGVDLDIDPLEVWDMQR